MDSTPKTRPGQVRLGAAVERLLGGPSGTLEQVAGVLGISERTARRRVLRGAIRSYRDGDAQNAPIRVTSAALVEYLLAGDEPIYIRPRLLLDLLEAEASSS